MILLISGSSASGKTTISNILSKKYKFYRIDGDQVIKDLGLKSKSWNLIHQNLINKSLAKHSHSNVVISHVVPLEKLSLYQDKFKQNKVKFKAVVLKPTKDVLLERNKIRTCHLKPTPTEVIDFFHTKFQGYSDNDPAYLTIDNSNQSDDETVKEIMNWVN